MPWKETSVTNEKTKFIARLLDGDSMTQVCDDFGISRKTGYKIWNRYQNTGAHALVDRSRKPHRFANQLPEPIERSILKLKKEKPHFGAPKIRELLARKFPGLRTPSISTVHAALDRNGLVNCRRRRRYCYPLTITDHSTRYLLAAEGLDSVKEATAFPVFERVFQEFGLPKAIRTDNGVPFATPNGLFGLSRLSVWWLRMGIQIERIQPGHPEQNGRHERMHLTLKKSVTYPAAMNFLAQQGKLDEFQAEYNNERPHEALGMKFPNELYKPSERPYQGIGRIDYPLHDRTITVTSCGRICVRGKKISFSDVFAGQDVGIREVSDRLWLVTFMNYDLGFFDEESKRFEPTGNPFGPKVLPVSL